MRQTARHEPSGGGCCPGRLIAELLLGELGDALGGQDRIALEVVSHLGERRDVDLAVLYLLELQNDLGHRLPLLKVDQPALHCFCTQISMSGCTRPNH